MSYNDNKRLMMRYIKDNELYTYDKNTFKMCGSLFKVVLKPCGILRTFHSFSLNVIKPYSNAITESVKFENYIIKQRMIDVGIYDENMDIADIKFNIFFNVLKQYIKKSKSIFILHNKLKKDKKYQNNLKIRFNQRLMLSNIANDYLYMKYSKLDIGYTHFCRYVNEINDKLIKIFNGDEPIKDYIYD